jgi:hypothetical protein
VSRLRDEAVPGVLAASWAATRPATVPARRRRIVWTPWGRVFAVSAAVAVAGAVLGILRVLDPHGGGIAVSLGAGLAFLAIGAQFLVDRIRTSRSRLRLAIGLVLHAHILMVPLFGIALVAYAIGSLVGYPGFR